MSGVGENVKKKRRENCRQSASVHAMSGQVPMPQMLVELIQCLEQLKIY